MTLAMVIGYVKSLLTCLLARSELVDEKFRV